MEVKAAVAHKAGEPLRIEKVNLEGPKAGEVMVEIKATGVCHTDAYTLSGADAEGLFPCILGHEGAGVVVEVGPGVTSVKPGDHVIPLYIPECRQCESCMSGKTNLCTAIRATQGRGVMPDARMAGANMIIGVDLNPEREAIARKFGATHFVNPKQVAGDLVQYLIDLTKGGADFAFECIGNVKVMRQALECCHRGWGTCVIIGVAAAGEEISTRPFQLVTGRVWKGTAFGGAKSRRDVPKIVDWYMQGKINIDDLITHTMPLERINEAFDLMHQGKSIRTVIKF